MNQNMPMFKWQFKGLQQAFGPSFNLNICPQVMVLEEAAAQASEFQEQFTWT